MILGTNSDHSRFHCLWSNELKWTNHHFYSIDFSFHQPETKFVEDENGMKEEKMPN